VEARRRSSSGLLTMLALGLAAASFADAQQSPAPATTEQVVLEATTFAPATFAVGDLVELRILLRSKLEPNQPRIEDGGPWLRAHSAELLPRGNDRWELRVTFSVFQPGIQTLPAIELGAFRIENVRVQADSVLGSTTDVGATTALQPLRRQAVMPGTTSRILAALLLVFAAPSLAAAVILRARTRIRAFLAERAHTRPRLRLERSMRRQLARLDADASQVTAEAFFVELSHNLRDYLEATFDIPAQASTTHELHEAFAAQRLAGHGGEELTEILATADRVKFGGDSAAASEMVAIGERLIELITDVETIRQNEGDSVES
jgi:hypothetical protein